MDKKIYNILNKIESSGHEAYIVGGYVRDFLLGKSSYDVDIATSASVESLLKLFKNSKSYFEYGCIKFEEGKFNISITSYRKELKYSNNKPSDIDYNVSLEEDALRRDFTINAIYMNKEGIIIDPFGGVKDLKNKEIKVIGNIEERFKEDANRILRALRFMSILNFSLDKNLLKFIINNKRLIKNINYEKKKEELDKIFKSKNYQIFLNFVKTNDLLNEFGLGYNNIKKCDNYLGIWAQIDFDKCYNFSKRELQAINSIKTDNKEINKKNS